MGNILNCESCGASNQLPVGKTSMFCAFCGNAIKAKREIKKEKRFSEKDLVEIPFEECYWYKKQFEDLKFSENIRKGMIREYNANGEYRLADFAALSEHLGDIKYSRTDGGYNVKKIFVRDGIDGKRKETKFIPFEYSLDLKDRGIKSFKEITDYFNESVLKQIGIIDLSYNNISNWDGISSFKFVRKLNLSNNSFQNFPGIWPTIEKDVPKCHIKKIDLSANRISQIPNIIPGFIKYNEVEIILLNNPLNSIPSVVKIEGYTDFKYNLSISERGILKLNKIEELKSCSKCGSSITKETFIKYDSKCPSCVSKSKKYKPPLPYNGPYIIFSSSVLMLLGMGVMYFFWDNAKVFGIICVFASLYSLINMYNQYNWWK